MDTDGTARLVTVPTTGAHRPRRRCCSARRTGVAYWAVRDPSRARPGEDPVDWADLRSAGAALDALGAGLLTTAVAVLNWHDNARFCGVDGSPTHPARRAGTGSARRTATRTTPAPIPR